MKLVVSAIDIDSGSKARLIDSLPDGWQYKTEADVQSQELANVEILMLIGPLSEDKIHSMPNLRFIQSFSAGVDHIDFSIVPSTVIVCSNSGAFAGPIAEFTLGSIIALARNLRDHDRDMREKKFSQWPPGLYLREKTIGILGTGGIGQSVAHLSKCFGMKTIGVNTTGNAVPGFDEVTTSDRLDDVLRRSDVIVVALALNVKTRNLLGRDQFGVMKPECILVNVARAEIIDQESLYNFLKSHPSAKAAIDVWWSRPESSGEFTEQFPVSELPNVMSSPHFSAGVPESIKLGSDSAVENVIHYLRNEPLKGVVSREDYLGLKMPASLRED